MSNITEQLLVDLPLYAENQLMIKPKTGPLIPFRFNRAQEYIHEQCEEQKKRTGRVRKIILKGRQQGCSTYVGARFYHKTVTRTSMLTFIFAHDHEASSSLYNMVKTYYDESVDKKFRPHLGTSNAKELLFPNLKSGYKVGTAGTKGLGRSKTLQQIHWSEVAYSPNCDDHAAGVMQTVADEDGTEIILESTANGQGNYFHRSCLQAMAGQGDFELIFVPWYWQPEYTRVGDIELTQPVEGQDFTSEQEYYDLFKDDGLTKAHLSWRRKKIADDFQGDIERFMREYPFTPEEAFESSGVDSYIKPILIRRARNIAPMQGTAPLIFGVDPARLGGDQFKVAHRKGRVTSKIDTYPKLDLVKSANRLAQDIDKYKPAAVNIDAGGLGVGLYDMMVDKGYKHIVNKVDFGGQSNEPEKYYMMTAEMFGKAREYLEDMPVSMQLLDEKTAISLQSELSAREHEWRNNSQLKMQSKKDFKKELGYSPDTADAWLLTFAVHVNLTKHQPRMQQTIIAQTDWQPFD